MTNKKKTLLIVLGVIGVALVAAGIVVASNWNKPLGEALALSTRTSVPTRVVTFPTDSPTSAPSENTPTIAPTETLVAIPTFTATPAPVCGDTPLLYFLVGGVGDKDENYAYGVTDVIRVVRVDFVTPKVSILTLPRDLYVELPNTFDSNGNALTHGKLNQPFFFGSPYMAYYKGPGYGAGALAETIATNFDLYVDHYGIVNMQVFIDMINAMGGVDVWLPEFVDGRPEGEESFALDKSQGYFDQGWNHMTGKDALSFVRIRARIGEKARTDNQTLLICALKDKLSQPSIIGTIPKLVSSLIENTQTDLTPAQISDLACLLPKLTGENLQFVSMSIWNEKSNPDGMLKPDNKNIAMLPGTSYVYTYDPEAVKAFIDKFENDQIEPTTDDGNGACPVPPAKP
jgi:LCP family protein required for cell wall assembly